MLTHHKPGRLVVMHLTGEGRKRKRCTGVWTITSPLFKSFCNTSAWLISFHSARGIDWNSNSHTQWFKETFFYKVGQRHAVNSWSEGGEGAPDCRKGGTWRRILILTSRTCSLGNAIWHHHTDPGKPVGWILQTMARFVRFSSGEVSPSDFCSWVLAFLLS